VTRRQRELAIAALGAVTAVNAIGGSIYGLSGAANVPREWLQGSPFRDYRLPSLILGTAVAGSSGAAAIAAWRASNRAGPAAIAAGTVLTGWIGAQVAIIGRRSFLQPLMAGVGVVLVGLGWTLGRVSLAA